MSTREVKGPFLAMPLTTEPWTNIPDGKALADWSHEDEVVYNQGMRQTQKFNFFMNTFDYLKDSRLVGDYHEYGCHRCRTFRMALSEARRRNIETMNFFAFDSFEGLPVTSDEHAVWAKGALATSEEEFLDIVRRNGVLVDRVHTVKGFYQSTLDAKMQRRFLDAQSKIALAVIDCDLYESAISVFRFIEPLLQDGSVIYIDDLFVGTRGSPEKGVARAFKEFSDASRFRFVRHLDVGWWGRSYISTFARDASLPAS